MTPKEKAEELIYRYHDDAISKMLIIQGNPFDFAKQCALIAVDEILEVIIFNKYDDKYWEEEEYWEKVKEELIKL